MDTPCSHRSSSKECEGIEHPGGLAVIFRVLRWISEAISLSLQLRQVDFRMCLYRLKGLGMINWKSRLV